MKRQRELEAVIEEIVSTGKAKNEKGEPVYPVMKEPLVMALFGAADALLDVLKERPIVVLNLLQSNKALDTFLNRFENLWPSLIDALVEKAMGVYASEIYPFVVVEKHRLSLSRTGEAVTTTIVEADFIGEPTFDSPLYGFHINYLSRAVALRSTSKFDIIYYDSLTHSYITLFRKMGILQQARALYVA